MNRLKQMRKEKGLTLDEMAKLTGIKRGTINNYENGKTEPKGTTWNKLADFFGVLPSYLMGEVEARTETELLDSLLNKVNAFNASSKDEEALDKLLSDTDLEKVVAKAKDLAIQEAIEAIPNLSHEGMLSVVEAIHVAQAATHYKFRADTRNFLSAITQTNELLTLAASKEINAGELMNLLLEFRTNLSNLIAYRSKENDK